MMDLIWLLIWALVLVGLVVLAFWLIDTLAGVSGWPAQVTAILKVIVGVVAALIVLSWILSVMPGGPPHLGLTG